jgi:hypothetical protein
MVGKAGPQDSNQPTKSKLLLPQDRWAASALSDENSQSSTPTRPKGIVISRDVVLLTGPTGKTGKN